MSEMGKMTKFVTLAYADGMLHENQTPEELLEALKQREGAEDAKYFIQHAAKTAFADLTVCEVITGKMKATNTRERGWMIDRLFEKSHDVRVAIVIGEAKFWDWQVKAIS